MTAGGRGGGQPVPVRPVLDPEDPALAPLRDDTGIKLISRWGGDARMGRRLDPPATVAPTTVRSQALG